MATTTPRSSADEAEHSLELGGGTQSSAERRGNHPTAAMDSNPLRPDLETVTGLPNLMVGHIV